jgi:hypothetical protein
MKTSAKGQRFSQNTLATLYDDDCPDAALLLEQRLLKYIASETFLRNSELYTPFLAFSEIYH